MTREQIERLDEIGYQAVEHGECLDQVAELKRLALLGLAVRESGVTAEDLVAAYCDANGMTRRFVSMDEDAAHNARMDVLFQALAKALEEAGR